MVLRGFGMIWRPESASAYKRKKISRLKTFFRWIRNFRDFFLDVPISRVLSDFQKMVKKSMKWLKRRPQWPLAWKNSMHFFFFVIFGSGKCQVVTKMWLFFWNSGFSHWRFSGPTKKGCSKLLEICLCDGFGLIEAPNWNSTWRTAEEQIF